MLNICKRASHSIASLYSAELLTVLLVMAAAFFWVFNFSSVPFSVPSFMRITGQRFLDIMPFYTTDKAFFMLEYYGDMGRELYLYFLAADFAFIPVYGLAFALLYTRAVGARFGASDAWLWLNLLPVLTALLDCVEDACILSMLLMYPKTTWLLGTVSGLATAAKWCMSCVSLACLTYLWAGLFVRRFVGSRHR